MDNTTARQKSMNRLREMLTDVWILRLALSLCLERLSIDELDDLVQQMLEVRELMSEPSDASVRDLRSVTLYDPRD